MPDLSKFREGSTCWVGDKSEAFPLGSPLNSRLVLDVVTDEVLLRVAQMETLLHTMPTNVEGNICGYRRSPLQRVRNVVIILHILVCEFHRGGGMSKVNCYALIGDAYRPKHAIGSDTWVEVVDLICRGNLSLIEVESNKTEGACVLLSVHPNVDALHETHVHVEHEGMLLTSTRVDARSRTPDVSCTNEALEVEDRRIFGASSGR